MKRGISNFKTVLIALSLVAVSGAAFAENISIDAGRYDLSRAHNERMIIFFGQDVSFKRYAVVDMLHQYFTVAADVRGGVRHTIRDTGGEKTLVIE